MATMEENGIKGAFSLVQPTDQLVCLEYVLNLILSFGLANKTEKQRFANLVVM